ncbi:MAG: efflux RND transporter periplasmic adaptor subunit [Phycisphaerae bacterium]|jgi:RND family efflux transporter MFP subunit
MSQKKQTPGKGSAVRVVVTAVVFTAVVVVLLMYLAGAFNRKLGAGAHGESAVASRPVGDVPLAEVRLVRVPAQETAVGTIRAVHQVSVASKLLARVLQVNAQAGQHVKTGEMLVRLDDEDLQARVRQAEAAVAAAEAARDQAQIEYDRVHGLYEQGNASRVEYERAETDLRARVAGLDQAKQALQEARTTVAYATIDSPIDGVVVDKRVEVGDMVTPGQVVVTLYDPTRMQLVAHVRESLAQRLRVGEEIGVRVDALHKTCAGQINEIVPEAEAASRSFAVKVTGPCPDGVYSGMFGRLLIPLDDEELLVVPQAAVSKVGQLDLVDVVHDTGADRRLERRAVRLGRTVGTDVEVLAGLAAGEQVALRAEERTDG